MLALSGLEGAVSTTEGITVLAPTNDAIDSTFPEGANEDTTERILQNHVIPQVILAADITDGQTATTLAGTELTFNVSGESVTVTDEAGNTRNIEVTNVRGTNGVVHAIDGVLLVN